MRKTNKILRSIASTASLGLTLVGMTTVASSQTNTVTYTLTDVQVDIGTSGGTLYPVTGQFDWTYIPGDFENGTAALTEISIPWYGTDISGLVTTIETSSLEFSLLANLHDQGVDVTLKLAQPLSTTQPSALDLNLSSFQVEQGVIHTGVFVSGTIEPQSDIQSICSGDGSSTPCPCNNNGAPGTGCQNSANQGALLWTTGTSSLAADDLAFQMTLGPGPSPALLFVGTQTVSNATGSPFGDGLLCAGGAIQRLDVKILTASGSANWGPSLSTQGAWSAGDFRVFQTWYRDVNGSPCGGQFNTSQAVSVAFKP